MLWQNFEIWYHKLWFTIDYLDNQSSNWKKNRSEKFFCNIKHFYLNRHKSASENSLNYNFEEMLNLCRKIYRMIFQILVKNPSWMLTHNTQTNIWFLLFRCPSFFNFFYKLFKNLNINWATHRKRKYVVRRIMFEFILVYRSFLPRSSCFTSSSTSVHWFWF